MADLQDRMKQAVAEAAVQQIRDGMVVGLGSGSTAALMIQGLGAKLQSGELKDITGVTTDRCVVVVDASKLVERLNLGFLLPVEVLPGAWRQVQAELGELGGDAQLRMAVRKAGPVVTDQGNLVLDVRFAGGIADPVGLEQTINNLPGVLENGLFVNITDQVLVGDVVDGVPGVRELVRR